MKRQNPGITFKRADFYSSSVRDSGRERRAQSKTKDRVCDLLPQVPELELFLSLPRTDVTADRPRPPVPASRSTAGEVHDGSRKGFPWPFPRSVLYNLAPRPGESLTSYLAYLAGLYVVPPRAVVSLLIKPFLRREITSAWPYSFECTFFSRTYALNGMDAAAGNLVSALERLTGRNDLRACTMLPFAGLLSDIGLMRRHRAWCPACLGEPHGKEHEELSWALAAIKVCHRHGLLLQTRCPHCGRKSPVLSSNARPGHCQRCDGWLGHRDARESVRAGERDSWVSKAVHLLLAGAGAAVLKREGLAGGVNRYVAEMFGGNRTHAARAIGVSPGTMFAWQHGTAVPTLDALLSLCYLCRISPADFYANAFPSTHRVDNESRGQARKQQHKRFDRTSVEEELRAALRHEPAQSMAAVARAAGRPENRLRYYYPDLCRQISARFTEGRKVRSAARQEAARSRVIRVVHEIHARGEYPSQRVVSALLPPGEFMNREVASAWREAVQKLALGQPGWTEKESTAERIPS